MESEWPPAPPEGYRLDDPKYDQPWYVTTVLLVWLIGVFAGVPALVISVHGTGAAVGIVREVLQPNGWNEWMGYLGWVVGILALFVGGHEALHALAGRWFGLRTKFRVQYNHPLSWSPEIITYGGLQSRDESLAITLAPLIVLTSTSVVALVMGQSLWVIASAAYIALGNSASAVGDLASAWVLWHLPDGELIYHDDAGRRQYYTPTRNENSISAN